MTESRREHDAAGALRGIHPLHLTAGIDRAIRESLRPDADVDGRIRALVGTAQSALLAESASLWLEPTPRPDPTSIELRCAAEAPGERQADRGVIVDSGWLDAHAARRADAGVDGDRHPIRRRRGSVLTAAVLGADRRLGLLIVERDDPAATFGGEERLALASLADRIAILLEGRGGPRSSSAERAPGGPRLEVLGRLTSGVAHDFNNALTAILGGVQLVAEGLPAASPLQVTASQTLDAIGFAADLSRQLLDFSHGGSAEPRVVALDEVVTRVDRLLRTLLGDRRQLDVRLGDDVPLVRAVPTQLAQVVLNLVANARDALPDGGRVELSTDTFDGMAVLRVRDEGIGMTEEIRLRIFEPSFSTKPPGVGSGIGLTTVRHVVEDLGGTLRVDSAPGSGSTFEILLPPAR